MVAATVELAHPVHQARSARTLQGILLAARKLLIKKDFEDISVAEIVRAARCSVGGFYARFSNKEAMLLVLEERLMIRVAEELEAELQQAEAEGGGIPELVSVYVRTMVARFREHRPILQAVVRRNQHPNRVLPHTRSFNTRVHNALLERILARRDQITHSDPESAAVLGLFFASASARDAVLGEKLEIYRHRIDDDDLATELIRAYLAFLGVPYRSKQ